jgi:hypothetical protein
MSDDSMMPTSTYQGCDCETCKELNVDCPDCPVCSEEESEDDSEVAMAMYDSSIGKADEVIEDPASFAGIGKDYTRSTKEIHRIEE